MYEHEGITNNQPAASIVIIHSEERWDGRINTWLVRLCDGGTAQTGLRNEVASEGGRLA